MADSNFFSKINKLLFGKPDINLIDNSIIDKVVSNLTSLYDTNIIGNFSELVSSILNNGKIDTLDDKQFFKIIGNKDLSTTDGVFKARIDRYAEIDALLGSLSRLRRALKVLASNIVAPDYSSAKVYSFEIGDDVETKVVKDAMTVFQNISKNVIDIEKDIKSIILKTCKYGDLFIEIVDVKKDIERKRNILLLSKSTNDINNDDVDIIEYEDEEGKKEIKLFIEGVDSFNSNKTAILEEAEQKSFFQKKSFTKRNIKDFYCRVISPKRVLRLGNSEVCFGYLVFPKSNNTHHEIQELSGTTSNGIYGFGDSESTQSAIINDLVMQIKNKLKLKFGDVVKSLDSAGLKTLNQLLMLMVQDVKNLPDKNLLIKFVSENNMQHFKIDCDEYEPYGTSFFEGVIFDAKLLLSSKVALSIDRISRSRNQQVAYVDIDFTNEVSGYIEKYKRKRLQEKITIDNDTKISAIPSMISDFETLYFPKKDEKKYIEFDQIERQDTSARTDDVKFARDELLGGINIPPAYLSVEENLESKCLSLDTKIEINGHNKLTLSQIIDRYNKGIEDRVWSYDEDKHCYFLNKIIKASVTRKNTNVCQLFLSNGESDVFTPDHPIRLINGDYVEVQKLVPGDVITPGPAHQSISVKEVKHLKQKIDTGDIQVERYHNFAINSGIIVHNSTLSFENIVFAVMILDYQKEFCHHFTELITKIYVLLNGTVPPPIKFVLNPPILLMVQTMIDYINNFSPAYDFLFNSIQMDKDKIIDKFMPYLREYISDSNKLSAAINKIKDNVSGAANQENETGGL